MLFGSCVFNFLVLLGGWIDKIMVIGVVGILEFIKKGLVFVFIFIFWIFIELYLWIKLIFFIIVLCGLGFDLKYVSNFLFYLIFYLNDDLFYILFWIK